MLLGLLLTLNIIVCLALITVVLLQRSEGGALGGGGSPFRGSGLGLGGLALGRHWKEEREKGGEERRGGGGE